MQQGLVGLVLLVSASAASASTDFGVRMVGAAPPERALSVGAPPPPQALSVNSSASSMSATRFHLSGAAGIGARYGRVTSTLRSPARNRAVGGVRNSWHLSGRAIDIARGPGVSHAQIAAAYRAAGYRLIESLDEGDHSHFAFSTGSERGPGVAWAPKSTSEVAENRPLTFRIVGGTSRNSR